MPTATGAETINERLTRLRANLARVRDTIARAENNGASNNIGGSAVTEVGYERAIQREKQLTAEISTLEARLSGSAARPGLAIFQTRMN